LLIMFCRFKFYYGYDCLDYFSWYQHAAALSPVQLVSIRLFGAWDLVSGLCHDSSRALVIIVSWLLI
jgi:hypothetical protein